MSAKQFSILFTLLLLLSSCHKKKQTNAEENDFPAILSKGEITAVTMNSSISYFVYKMQSMGYEYDLIADFARSHRLKLNIKVAENVSRLTEMLENREADVIAYPIQINNKLKQEFLFCGYEKQSNLVIVQRANRGDTILTDVTQLIGKEIYVKENTRYYERLQNLNMELGGGIQIKNIEKDTITIEDLIEKVSRGVIPYTICEDDVARLNRTYFRNINIALDISFKQRSSWAVRKNTPLLAEAIDEWVTNKTGKKIYQAASKRYFEISKSQPSDSGNYQMANGHISPYDPLFKRYAPSIGWDWLLLASIAYQESHFEPTIVAWSGAEGIMGVMPGTAEALGYQPEDMKDPEKCIQAGVECLRRFGQSFTGVPDSLERIKLTLASYNAGMGHIYDAQRLAEKYGKNPEIWNDNVAEFIRLKSEPEYYTDSLCKYGYMRGSETINYVYEILERYDYYTSLQCDAKAGK